MIVKIQQPLNDKTGPIFVYDETKRFQMMLARTPHLMEKLGNKPKIYADAAFESGELVVLKVVGNQPW
jgi:hypothetical protein